jgi:hypothetical protein
VAIAAGLAAAALLGTSCHRQVETQCYDVLPRPEVDPTQLPPDLPFCDVTVSTVPDPPDGYGFTHRVGAGFVPTDDDPCDPCDLERFEELLRAAIQDRTSQDSPSCARTDPSEPVGLCVHEPDETSDECRVLGVFYSNGASGFRVGRGELRV